MREDPNDSKPIAAPHAATDPGDQRQYPRASLNGQAALFSLDEGSSLLGNCDISLGGLCFLSDRNFEVGRRMSLNIMNLIGIEIEVKHTKMEMVDSTFMEAKYRVGCQFVDGPIDQDFYEIILRTAKEKTKAGAQPV